MANYVESSESIDFERPKQKLFASFSFKSQKATVISKRSVSLSLSFLEEIISSCFCAYRKPMQLYLLVSRSFSILLLRQQIYKSELKT